MSDQETSDFGVPSRWLLVGVVIALFLAVGVIGFLYEPQAPERVCSKAEARCGEQSDVVAP